MQLKLEQIESHLRAIIEIKLMSALPGFKVEELVVQKLAEAIKSNLVEGNEGSQLAPNVYTLIVHPSLASTWQEPLLLKTMIAAITAVGEEAGFHFISPPTVSINQNADQEEGLIEVVASHQIETAADTKGMTPIHEPEPPQATEVNPENAFLIVNGVKVFSLDQTVINIGRRMDNQLVIDDPRISRNHAQLRAIKGRYVIFDLNSTGGTYINGQKISQSVLYPGDVISLAGVTLVFGQDNQPMRSELTDTSPLKRASIDRPTALLNWQTGKFKDEKKSQ